VFVTNLHALHPAPDWRSDYRAAAMPLDALLGALGLARASLPYAVADTPFPLRVPPHFLSLIRSGDPFDPLLLQVLSRADELLDTPGTSTDPLGEAGFGAGRGVLRKYGSRALLLAAGAKDRAGGVRLLALVELRVLHRLADAPENTRLTAEALTPARFATWNEVVLPLLTFSSFGAMSSIRLLASMTSVPFCTRY
jgi:hypothetical protein